MRPFLQPTGEASETAKGDVGVGGLRPGLEDILRNQAWAVGLAPDVLEVPVNLEGLRVCSPYNEFSVA